MISGTTSVRSVANHFTTSYTCKQPNVIFFLVDGGGANEIGQQTNSARHPLISDIHPVQGIFYVMEPQRLSHPRYLPSLHPNQSNLLYSSVGLIPYYPPTYAYVPRALSYLPIFQNKNTVLSFFPPPSECHMRNPCDINSTDTYYRLKYSCRGTNRLYVYGGRCEAPFLIRQIHSRPASCTYTPRS